MPKLTTTEKEFIIDQITSYCGGTPLQPHAEFAGGYIGHNVISMIENWDVIRKALAEQDKAEGRDETAHHE